MPAAPTGYVFGNFMDILIEIALDALLWTLFGGGLFAVLVGVWLLLSPQSLMNFSRIANRWVSTRQATQWLETPRPIERFFYRHHKIFGVLLTLGAAFALYYLTVRYDSARMAAGLALPWKGPTVEIVADALLGFLIAGNIFVVGIGFIVLIRPSLLKRVEATSNRWISTRRLFKTLDNQSDLPDRFAVRQPRLLGVLLILGALYATLQLGLMLSGR